MCLSAFWDFWGLEPRLHGAAVQAKKVLYDGQEQEVGTLQSGSLSAGYAELSGKHGAEA